MQRIFAEKTPWHTPWMDRVLPVVQRLAEARPAETVFTRFIPPRRPEDAEGQWRRYFQRWDCMTMEALAPGLVDLVEPLARLAPPAEVVDKKGYSPWWDGFLDRKLRLRGVGTLIVTGAETDVCVLATVLGAVDRGYRVLIPSDAICSSSDETHEALLTLYRSRFSQQIEVTTAQAVLDAWH